MAAKTEPEFIKPNILTISHSLDPVYARKDYLSRIHTRWSKSPSDGEVTKYLENTIGECVRAICAEAAKRLTTDLVVFVGEQLKKTDPWVGLSNADALNTLGRDFIRLHMRDDVLAQAIKCEFEYFDARTPDRLTRIKYERKQDEEGNNIQRPDADSRG